MIDPGTQKPQRFVIATLIVCAVASLSMAVSANSATASEASTLPVYDGAETFPSILGPGDPEEFSWRVEMAANQSLHQTSETQAAVIYQSGLVALTITAEPAHDAEGKSVPTTLQVSEGDVVTLVVHHRAGNPAAGGAPFAYPILAGPGWEGGIQTVIVKGPPDEAEERAAREAAEIAARPSPPAEPLPGPPAPAPASCSVPALRGLTLRAAKAGLRAGDCTMGIVRLAHGATAAKGTVVRQAIPPGWQLPAEARVAVRLGAR